MLGYRQLWIWNKKWHYTRASGLELGGAFTVSSFGYTKTTTHRSWQKQNHSQEIRKELCEWNLSWNNPAVWRHRGVPMCFTRSFNQDFNKTLIYCAVQVTYLIRPEKNRLRNAGFQWIDQEFCPIYLIIWYPHQRFSPCNLFIQINTKYGTRN